MCIINHNTLCINDREDNFCNYPKPGTGNAGGQRSNPSPSETRTYIVSHFFFLKNIII